MKSLYSCVCASVLSLLITFATFAQTITLPTELAPGTLITSIATQSSSWLLPGITLMIVFGILVALVRGFMRRSKRAVG